MRAEDRPPEHIWLDSEELTAHFERLENKYNSDTPVSDDDAGPADLEQNELTRALRR